MESSSVYDCGKPGTGFYVMVTDTLHGTGNRGLLPYVFIRISFKDYQMSSIHKNMVLMRDQKICFGQNKK